MLKALYDEKFPPKQTQVSKDRSGRSSSSSGESGNSTYEFVTAENDVEKRNDESGARGQLPIPVCRPFHNKKWTSILLDNHCGCWREMLSRLITSCSNSRAGRRNRGRHEAAFGRTCDSTYL